MLSQFFSVKSNLWSATCTIFDMNDNGHSDAKSLSQVEGKLNKANMFEISE